MFGRNFTGRDQRGGIALGFRGSAPPYPYVGRGRGGLPKCSYLGSRANLTYKVQGIPREEEISLLKSQAENIKKELGMVESRIRDLEAGK